MIALLVVLGVFALMLVAAAVIGWCFAGAYVRRAPRSRAERLSMVSERGR